jgi:hypothetical protein
MIERWRFPRPVAITELAEGTVLDPAMPPFEISLFAGWTSITIGADLERHPREWTFTLRVPFLHLVIICRYAR